MPCFLVTGATGFVGSHIVEEVLSDDDNSVVTFDRMKHIGRLDRLGHLAGGRLRVVNQDLAEAISNDFNRCPIDYVIHNAAESHVSRSFADPEGFVRSNVIGTLNMLELARRLKPKKFVYVSTDEVFGPAVDRPHRVGDRLCPTNLYAATKASGEYLVRSYWRSFGVPAVTTRTSNMFGERQDPEKFVPLVVKQLLRGDVIDVHTSDEGEIGSRQWTYVGEQAQALVYLAKNGEPGETYHVRAGETLSNLDIVSRIADVMSAVFDYRLVASDRLVHDLHYSIEESTLSHNWKSDCSFDDLLLQTVRWYKAHPRFLGL